MRIFLIVLLTILLFLCLLLLLPLRLVCRFSTEDGINADVRLKVLGIPFPLFSKPKKEKKPRLRDFTLSALKKRGEKQKKKEQKQKRKKQLKQAKKQKRTEKKGSVSEKKSEQTPTERITALKHTLKLVRALLSVLLEKFGDYLRVEVKYFDIRIGTDDPAKTAVLYGGILAALEALFAAIGDSRPMRRVKKSDISLTADFCAATPTFRGELAFHLHLWHLLSMLLRGGGTALRMRAEQKKNESTAARLKRERDEAEARAALLRELKS